MYVLIIIHGEPYMTFFYVTIDVTHKKEIKDNKSYSSIATTTCMLFCVDIDMLFS